MGYVLVEVPKGVHLIATTIIYQAEMEIEKDLPGLVGKKIEMTKQGLLEAIEKKRK